jgi:hypothetical protein
VQMLNNWTHVFSSLKRIKNPAKDILKLKSKTKIFFAENTFTREKGFSVDFLSYNIIPAFSHIIYSPAPL